MGFRQGGESDNLGKKSKIIKFQRYNEAKFDLVENNFLQ